MFKLNHILCLTSLIAGYHTQFINDNFFKFFSQFLFITSELFWFDGLRNTWRHKLDVVTARSYVFYGLCLMKNKKCLNLLNISIPLLFYVGSRFHSHKKWLSWKHVFFHGMFHLTAMLSLIHI